MDKLNEEIDSAESFNTIRMLPGQACASQFVDERWYANIIFLNFIFDTLNVYLFSIFNAGIEQKWSEQVSMTLLRCSKLR